MSSVLRKERVREILAADSDIAIRILSLAKDSLATFSPLRLAATRALSIVDKVQRLGGSKRAWRKFGLYVKDSVGEVALRWEVSQYGSAGSFETWKTNIEELRSALTETSNLVETQAVRREHRSAFQRYSPYWRDPGKINLLQNSLDVILRKFELSTDTASEHTLAWVVTNDPEIVSKLRSIERFDIDSDPMLGQLRVVPNARHNSSKICLEGTRTGIIEEIMARCCNAEHHMQVTLLTAVAGAGKSTVAHTIAKRCDECDILLASFFFRAGEITSLDHLWSDVARSLAIRNEPYRRDLTSALTKDPTIAAASFGEQFEELIVKPLRRNPLRDDTPLIIVIDAFDECDPRASITLALHLRNKVSELPRSIKFVVTSRRTIVVDRFLLQNLSPIHHLSIHLSDDNNLEDCNLYIRSEVSALRKLFPWSNWPPGVEVMLAARARGLFITVSTVMEHLKNESANPVVTLEDLLDQSAPRDDEPTEEQLDTLYTAILKTCAWRDKAFVHNYPIVMGAITAAKSPLSITAWDALLSPLLFPGTTIEDTISELRPLLTGTDQPSDPIQLLNQSLRDYLESRNAGHLPIMLDPSKDQERLALRCFQVMSTEIRKVPGLGTIKMLCKMDVMPTIPHEDVSEQLLYACRFGWDHALEIKDVSEALEIEIWRFLKNIVDWVELCVRRERYISILPLVDWIEKNCRDLLEVSLKEKIAFFLGIASHHLKSICRFTEARDTAADAVSLYRSLFAENPAYAPDLARELQRLGDCLTCLNRHMESLEVTQECVSLLRPLALENPETYSASLAGVLCNMGISLSGLSRYTEALDATQESISLYRPLVSEDPASHAAGIVRALRNLGSHLSELNRHIEGLEATQECLSLFRSLFSEKSASHTADLARNLGSLGCRFSDLNRHTEALEAAQECVSLLRSLVSENQAPYIAHLARELGDMGNHLSKLNRHTEAIEATEECVSLFRSLVRENPASYTPCLAYYLGNLGFHYSELNRHVDALEIHQESVSLYRSLTSENPASYTAGLAVNLGNLGLLLSTMRRHRESLNVTQESVSLLRSLVAETENPGAFTRFLAQALFFLSKDFSSVGRHTESLAASRESQLLSTVSTTSIATTSHGA